MTAAEVNEIISYEHLDEGLEYDSETKSYTDGDMVLQLITLSDGNCGMVRVYFKAEPDININFKKWDYEDVRPWLLSVFDIERTKKKLTNVWYAEKGFCFLDGKLY